MADTHFATKTCARCAAHKPLTEFNKDKSSGDGLQYKCRACQKAVRRDWYERNREREIQKVKDWAKSNPEKAREKDRRRHAAHPERSLNQGRRWRAANPEKYLAQKRAWKAANPEKVRATARAAYAKNPERELAKAHARRVKSPATGTVFTRKDVARIFALQKGKCACCKISLGDRYHRDHVIPLALGGTNDHLNIQLLCAPCNRKKHAKHPVDFMQENGFLL
jgi:5-methylcytosine-specific restriction endonuclease McrA